jgi:hypothetical protein
MRASGAPRADASTLRAALEDAIAYRSPDGDCGRCAGQPGGCADHAGDLARVRDYGHMARQLEDREAG